MKNKYFFAGFFVLFILSAGIFAQTRTTKIVSGENRENAGLTRPRIYESGNSRKNNSTANSAIVSGFERKVFEQINQKRIEKSLEVLTWNNDCAKIARFHSEEMANNHFFNHAGLDGTMVSDRADNIGLNNWRAIGENIAYNRGFENPLESAVEGWMKSPSHHDNILNSGWKESAVGIAVASDGAYYFTQVFLLRQ